MPLLEKISQYLRRALSWGSLDRYVDWSDGCMWFSSFGHETICYISVSFSEGWIQTKHFSGEIKL